MNWDTPYVMSRSTIARPRSYDTFTLTSSVSSNRFNEMDSNGLLILSFFASPATPQEAFAEFGDSLEITEGQLTEALGEMVKIGLLLPARERRAGPELPTAGFGRLDEHHSMLADRVRTMAYRAALFRQVPGQTVLDLGCGTGILSIFASQAGARQVYAIEETGIVDLARELAKANGAPITFVRGNSLHVEVPERVDIIVHELIGVDPFCEDMLSTLQDARERFLGENGRLIPYRFDVCCYGFERNGWADPERAVLEAREFANYYGVNLEPMIQQLRASRQWGGKPYRELPLGPGWVLSDEACLYQLDLYSDLSSATAEEVQTMLDIRHPGRLNAVAVGFRAYLDEEFQLATTPYGPRTHWWWHVHDLPRSFRVEPGDCVTLRARVVTVGHEDQLQLALA